MHFERARAREINQNSQRSNVCSVVGHLSRSLVRTWHAPLPQLRCFLSLSLARSLARSFVHIFEMKNFHFDQGRISDQSGPVSRSLLSSPHLKPIWACSVLARFVQTILLVAHHKTKKEISVLSLSLSLSLSLWALQECMLIRRLEWLSNHQA